MHHDEALPVFQGVRNSPGARAFLELTMPDRADALVLVEQWVGNVNLRKHMFAVEAAVRHYARMRGGDEETWGLAGLLHDMDWEMHPEEHPLKAVGRTQGGWLPRRGDPRHPCPPPGLHRCATGDRARLRSVRLR